MNRRKTHRAVLLIVAILPALMSAAGLAAAEHKIILEIEIEGDETCPTLVTVSAQGCDGDELTEILCAELDREGLPAIPSNLGDPPVCTWLRPTSGCSEVRERMILEPGSDCEDDNLKGKISLLEAPGGEDTVGLVEIEIEIPGDP